MRPVRHLIPAALLLALATMPASARVIDIDDSNAGGAGSIALPPYLQCVPYARQLTGVQIYGDALTWWDQADGRYARGYQPRVGAVMAFRPYGNSRLGHVAAVSKIIDSRTVLISHANWSPINGRRGQIEDNVRAVDVSPDNDWSEVRVWYGPSQALGNTRWPLAGFIYAKKPRKNESLTPRAVLARADTPAKAAPSEPRKVMRSTDSDDPIAAIIKRELAI